ncbi:unnamed protein product [Urochloa decumbens]|uniref:F-box domain-containing protein n=1 Tax=Urochloa decumbens TaxID=240449 RepID=A0ABC9FMD0_9POAL
MAPPPPASRHLPPLMDELLEQIFIRLPIDDPATLFRAALVCKSWRYLISGPALRRRLLELHGSPPLCGFFCRVGGEPASRFVPSSSSSLCRLSAGNVTPRWRPVDSLHGRVLIEDEDAPGLWDMRINLVLWNPIGGEVRRLPSTPVLTYQWNAALLCMACGCDHLDCGYGGGHFQVVLAGTRSSDGLTSACVYSSEQRAWSKPVSAHFDGVQVKVGSSASAIAENTLYLLCDMSEKILKYDLGKQQLSLIRPPIPDNFVWQYWYSVALMRAEGGGVGFSMTQKSKIFMWSREATGLDNGDARWVQRRVIELDKMIPGWSHWYPLSTPYVTAVAEHVNVIFIDACNGLFSIDLKSGLVTELLVSNSIIRDIVPYVSFGTPGISLVSCNLALVF